MNFKHATGELALEQCLVMGIVNRTPDSFYDGGRVDLDRSVDYALSLVEEGADVLDLGAVKAGPGAEVDAATEGARLLPLVEALASRTDVPISVETGRPNIARVALAAGASIVNDVTGLADRETAGVCAEAGAGLILMHHGGQLRGRPRHPRYEDVVGAVEREWTELTAAAAGAGVDGEHVVVDPGLDFGKTTWHSLELIRRLPELVGLGWPVLLAPSRKDVVGETLDLPVEDRLEGTLALVALAVEAGVAIVRVHDVAAACRTVRMVEAVLGKRPPTAPLRGLWD
ncbi:MAG: dihydropteroate synthase [Actinomycetota bacterium]